MTGSETITSTGEHLPPAWHGGTPLLAAGTLVPTVEPSSLKRYGHPAGAPASPWSPPAPCGHLTRGVVTRGGSVYNSHDAA